MNRIVALAIALSLSTSASLAQNVPANSVQGRLAIPTGGGPVQAIPFSALATALFGTSVSVPVLNVQSIIVTPPPLSTTQGLKITQTSPTSGSISGPWHFNEISCNNQVGANTTGPDPFVTNAANCLRITMTEGGNATGFQNALYVRLNHTIPFTISTVGIDHIATTIIAYGSQNANGAGLYASDIVAWAISGGQYGNLVGSEVEVYAATGTTIGNRVGVRLHSEGNVQGSTSDSALTVVSDATNSWKHFVTFGEIGTAQAISTTGDMFKSLNTMTVANVFNLSNMTVTGNILNFPHVKLDGGGGLALNQSLVAAPTPFSPASTMLNIVTSGTTIASLESFGAIGTAAGGYLNFRASRGAMGTPAALQLNDQIGGLLWMGYGATGYSSNARALIVSLANETWTDTAQGTVLSFKVTTNGSATAAEMMRLENNGLVNLFGVGIAITNSIADVGVGLNNTGASGRHWDLLSLNSSTTHGSAGAFIIYDETAAQTRFHLTSSGALTLSGYGVGTLSSDASGNITSSGLVVGGSATSSILTIESTTGAGATDAIIFKTATQVQRGSINSSGQWHIGANLTPNAGVSLTVNANSVALPAPETGTITQIGSANGNLNRLALDAFGTGAFAGINYRAARGTAASPTATQSGDTIGFNFGKGYGATGYDTNAGAGFVMVATENYTDSAAGARLDIYATATGASATGVKATVFGSGGLSVNTSSDPGAGMIYTNAATFMIRTKTSYTNGAAAQSVTMTNSPASGNPTKWIPVDDNGTTRYIPAW